MDNQIGTAIIDKRITAVATYVVVYLNSDGPLERPGEQVSIEVEISLDTYEWHKQEYSLPDGTNQGQVSNNIMACVMGSVSIRGIYDSNAGQFIKKPDTYPHLDQYTILNERDLKKEVINIVKERLGLNQL